MNLSELDDATLRRGRREAWTRLLELEAKYVELDRPGMPSGPTKWGAWVAVVDQRELVAGFDRHVQGRSDLYEATRDLLEGHGDA